MHCSAQSRTSYTANRDSPLDLLATSQYLHKKCNNVNLISCVSDHPHTCTDTAVQKPHESLSWAEDDTPVWHETSCQSLQPLPKQRDFSSTSSTTRDISYEIWLWLSNITQGVKPHRKRPTGIPNHLQPDKVRKPHPLYKVQTNILIFVSYIKISIIQPVQIFLSM